ncbi:helix-turn-helix domain-containing protein [Kitasatospora sp. NPDC101155]|uniref:helix-turn-helix domain-containing protein n=1 Tax=Kitasatospora sp. NPDC101155 TaxID=3364097 RepID=UPI0038122D74
MTAAMGRPEKEIPATSGRHLRVVAARLRELRAAAGRTYQELSKQPGANGYSPAALRSAASGACIPTEQVVTAFAKACEADPNELLSLRLKAARAAAWDAEPDPPRRLSPCMVNTVNELRTAMRYIHLQAGKPSTRALEEGAGGRLPHSTLDRVLDTKQKPRMPSEDLLKAFLQQCGVAPARQQAWLDARQRLVDNNPRLKEREQRRWDRERTRAGHWYGCTAAEEAHMRREENQKYQALRRTRAIADDLDYGIDFDGEEECTDQRAIEYAYNRALFT